MATNDFKTVAKYSEPIPAEILAGMLRENGIPAAVFGASSPYPCLNYAQPIEVKVNAEDYERALALVPEEDRVQE
ncbi:MAG: DUF2007 domain-containing protein [Bacteroidales bacterium]|jgi:hypothetical protein|nr:DUF2007 domain-containing protein [Bacteroidales bacterium]